MTDCKDCSTEQGRKDLINTPISITYSKAQFPNITRSFCFKRLNIIRNRLKSSLFRACMTILSLTQ